MPLTVEAAREADRAEAQLLLLRMGIAPMPERRIRKWSHVAWNDSRAGSLDSTALGGVERREHPAGTRPSIGSSNKRPQLPGWGRFS
jgi:hypothetical protein